MTEGVVRAIKEYSPDLILIHGDTLSAFCAGIAAFFEGIPIGHVEAGLRTYSRTPYPEEFCRRSIAAMADYHFAPTSRARENLLREGVPDGGIFVCGNTVVDALRYTLRRDFSSQILDKTCGAPFILITSHRRESLGAPMLSMLRAVADALREYPLVKAIFPLHPNPEVRRIARSALSGLDNVIFTEPLGVVEFHNILAECGFVLTDSGGIQEEAAALGKVALVMREHTEREEGVGGFGIRTVGTDPREIYAALSSALATCERRRTIAIKENPFGDGFASRRIVDAIESVLK